jgi:signal transduction histidine kinase
MDVNSGLIGLLLVGTLLILLLLLVIRRFRERKAAVKQEDVANLVAQVGEVQADLLVLAERKRIGRDLHDSTMQSLYAIGLRLEHSLDNAALPGEVRQTLQEILQDLRATMIDMRKYVENLASVKASSVQEHLETLVEELQRQLMTRISFRTTSWIEPGYSAQSIKELGMVVREAITNAVRHGKAQNIEVVLQGTTQGIQIRVTDDGQGFATDDAGAGAHHGLRHMNERVELLGGSLQIENTVGRGTTVVLQIPHR